MTTLPSCSHDKQEIAEIFSRTSKKRRKLVSSSCSDERHMEWRVYTGNHHPFQKGDAVFVRPKSARREMGIHGRLFSRCEEDTGKWKLVLGTDDDNDKEILVVDENRLIPVFASSQQKQEIKSSLLVLITSETRHYRQLTASQLLYHHQEDAVLEIGCSTGETSELVWKRASSWIGFDTSAQMVERTVTKYTTATTTDANSNNHSSSSSSSSCRIACHKIDALLEPEQALQMVHQHQQQSTSVVLMDIGGNREIYGVARMMKWIFTSFPQLRLIVVKSEALVHELSGQAISDDGILLVDGMEFLEQKLLEFRRLPPHPLQAPKAYSPTDPSRPICRYHNYHKKGCRKESACPFDHAHCHMCLEPGHIAKDCNQWKR